ncbi:MAG TPA: SRPBCC family protein [Streptosporangiaceae bacterium]|nr:SRPBCC family protein [Streptosporangiaceae bacterium]
MADRTSSSITINSGKPAIMTAIADFAAYPTWAEGVRSAEVLSAGADDRAERVRFTLEAGPIKDSYVLAYDWHGDDAVQWNLAERGKMVTEMSGSYQLAGGTGAADVTDVTYELTVNVSIPMLGMFKRKAEKMIIDTALKGLKRHVER